MLGRRVGRPPKGGDQGAGEPLQTGARRRRSLSDEARKRIAAAQKKRWAAYRKTQSK
jgi:hypothetical protein